MTWRKHAIKFLAETLVGNVLSQVGEHIGDALGLKLGRKIEPEHRREPKPNKPDDESADDKE